MKVKIVFLALSLAAALCANATDTYDYTFEDAGNTPTTSSTSGNVTVNASATNTLTDGINNSATCLSLTTNVAAANFGWWWEGAYVNLPSSAAASGRYIYMKVRADIPNGAFNANFGILLFKDDTDLNIPLSAIPGPRFDGTWKEYCFEIPSTADFNKIRIQPRNTGTFYIDDIRLSDVAPTIPDLKGLSCDFEDLAIDDKGNGPVDNNWILNGMYPISDGEYIYVDPTSGTPIAENGTSRWLRFHIGNGAEPNYGGVRYTGVYGKTTESTRYLHFRYYFAGGTSTTNQSMRIFTHGGNDAVAFTSDDASIKGQWNDVTVDLGVGTLVEYLAFNMAGQWIDVGIDDIVLNGESSRSATDLASFDLYPSKVGERAIKYGSTDKATSATTDFSEHYRLIFPGTQVLWNQTIPTGYTANYSTTINGRTFTGSCYDGFNYLDELYGVYGQKSVTVKITYTPTASNTTGTEYVETMNVPLEYFGSKDITGNTVNIDSITPQLFTNGEAVATVHARETSDFYVPSYYAPMKASGSSDNTVLNNYSNATIVPAADSTKLINISEMQARKVYLMSPAFSDVAKTTTAGTNLAQDFTVNYAVVTHYLMVTSGPFTKDEMSSIVKTVDGTINTLQDSWTLNANVPATISRTADDLYAHSSDVGVSSIAGDEIGGAAVTNHMSVTFKAGLVPTGIEGVSAGAVSIVGGEGIINITGASNAVVYDFMGRMIKSVNNQSIINVPSGLYIVKAGGKVCKVKVD
ncbi:MAG: hypothetical protein LKF31_01635 [Muribaculaceae bacterium]|nr:hypothetical protein [Muribaculaceae bacterium]